MNMNINVTVNMDIDINGDNDVGVHISMNTAVRRVPGVHKSTLYCCTQSSKDHGIPPTRTSSGNSWSFRICSSTYSHKTSTMTNGLGFGKNI